MKARRRYEIRFDRLALDHLSRIEPKYDSLLQRTIKEQLSFEPLTETRNWKRLEHESVLGALGSPLWPRQPIPHLLSG